MKEGPVGEPSAFDWSVWGPPLVVLLLGLVVGLVVALRARRGGMGVAAGEEAALLARKEMLLEQVRSMEADRDKLDATEFSQRKDALVAEAALVLKALDELRADPEGIEAAAESAGPTPRKGRMLAAYAAGAVLLFAVLGAGLTEFTKPRPEGGSMTGGGPAEGGDGPMAALAAETAAAEATLASDPTNLEALNVVSYDQLLRGDLKAAMATIDRARAVDPEDPAVLTHLAMLQLAIGMGERATTGLEQAIAARPEWGRPRLWMGLARSQAKDRAGTLENIELALSLGLNPIERQFAMQLMAEARAPAAAAAASAGAGAGAGATGDPPPVEPGEQRLAGTLSLAEGVAADPNQRVFVIVHRNAQGAGPPVAAKTLPASALPTPFVLSDRDVMMGGPWPDEVFVFARLDADGSAGSSEGDVESKKLGPLPKGTLDVALVIGG